MAVSLTSLSHRGVNGLCQMGERWAGREGGLSPALVRAAGEVTTQEES